MIKSSKNTVYGGFLDQFWSIFYFETMFTTILDENERNSERFAFLPSLNFLCTVP